jgi:predicted transcriptional regulator
LTSFIIIVAITTKRQLYISIIECVISEQSEPKKSLKEATKPVFSSYHCVITLLSSNNNPLLKLFDEMKSRLMI